jgi:hypothetical protein
MSNVVLSWPNYVEKATLSSTTAWVATLPLTQLKNPILGDIAKTAATTTKIKWVYDKHRALGTVALARHNFSISAQARIRVFYDAAETTVLYDSGYFDVWPSVYDSLELEWEDDNFWLGKPENDEREQFTSLFYHYLPENYGSVAGEIEIVDPDNPDGFLSAGRLFLSKYFVPELNVSYGAFSRGAATSTTSVQCGDTDYWKVRAVRRTKNLGFDWLSESEANQLYQAQLTNGLDKEVLYSDELERGPYSITTSFLGTLENLNPIDQPNFAQNTMKINLKEKL